MALTKTDSETLTTSFGPVGQVRAGVSNIAWGMSTLAQRMAGSRSCCTVGLTDIRG